MMHRTIFFNWPIVSIHKEIRCDRKNIFCAADALLSDKKKISSFSRTVAEIFNFYSGKVTFGPPCRILKTNQYRFENYI